jgi:hypothetical protein
MVSMYFAPCLAIWSPEAALIRDICSDERLTSEGTCCIALAPHAADQRRGCVHNIVLGVPHGPSHPASVFAGVLGVAAKWSSGKLTGK